MSELRGEHVTLAPMAPQDAPALREIRATRHVATWWGRPTDDFPHADEPDVTRFTIRRDGEIVGLIQYGEERDPDFRHATVDLFLAPAASGHGLGTDAVATLVRHLQHDRGHHRITIDPAADNAAAIRCYEKVGFREVGRMRRAWRDLDGVWRDGLLMELVTEPGP